MGSTVPHNSYLAHAHALDGLVRVRRLNRGSIAPRAFQGRSSPCSQVEDDFRRLTFLTCRGDWSNIRRKGILAFLAIILSFSFAAGCSAGDVREAEVSSRQGAPTTGQVSAIELEAGTSSAEKEEPAVAEIREATLTSFIEAYNSASSVPFVLSEYFDPQDRDGAHYRTEYRLNAWADGKGANGTIGDINVDFVSYRDGVRMYASLDGVDTDGRTVLLGDALNAYLGDCDSSSIQAFVQEYRESGNTELSGSKLMQFDKRLNGYILQAEMMLEAK